MTEDCWSCCCGCWVLFAVVVVFWGHTFASKSNLVAGSSLLTWIPAKLIWFSWVGMGWGVVGVEREGGFGEVLGWVCEVGLGLVWAETLFFSKPALKGQSRQMTQRTIKRKLNQCVDGVDAWASDR